MMRGRVGARPRAAGALCPSEPFLCPGEAEPGDSTRRSRLPPAGPRGAPPATDAGCRGVGAGWRGARHRGAGVRLGPAAPNSGTYTFQIPTRRLRT